MNSKGKNLIRMSLKENERKEIRDSLHGLVFGGKSWKKTVSGRREMTAFFNANENNPVKKKIWCGRKDKRKMLQQLSLSR